MGAPAPSRPARPPVGEELDLDVTDLAFGGNGVARHNGFVVFVAGGIPGDRVRAVVTKRKRAYGEARVTEVLTPSPERLAPVADHPGAPWQVLPYERQLAVKAAQVDEALRRIGRLDGHDLEPIVPASQTWRYRNKLEYSFGCADDGTLLCGFHAPGRWDRIDPLGDCLLASEAGNAVRERVLAWCREQGRDDPCRRADREPGGVEPADLRVRAASGPDVHHDEGVPLHVGHAVPRAGNR